MGTRTLLRRLVLLGAPLPLVVVGLIHPRIESLSAGLALAGEHLALHLVLIPLFGLMGLAGALLTSGAPGRASSISRAAMLIFVVLYTAYSTFAGVAFGMLLHTAGGLTPAHQSALYDVLVALDASALGIGVGLAFFGAGTLAWIAGMIAAVVALARAGVPREPLILLVLAGVFLVGDHSTMLGSVAFGCFFLAAAWLEFVPRRLTQPQVSEVS